MSDREQHGLRGPIKACVVVKTRAAFTDAQGKSRPENKFEDTREYDLEGRMTAERHSSSGGSEGVMQTTNVYDSSGRKLKWIYSPARKDEPAAETVYSYDDDGRLRKITDSRRPDNPIVFHYDELGRKIMVQVFRPEDYRPNTAVAGSPFDRASHPNLEGGGTSTGIFDEHDRPTEIQVSNAQGELLYRAVRIYDAQGRIIEEKQLWEDPVGVFPAEVRAKMSEPSSESEQLREKLRTLFSDSVSYSYDAEGHLKQEHRRVANQEMETETTYNQYGDKASEIRRSTKPPINSSGAAGIPEWTYSEARYSYKYDDHGNWIEQASSNRSSPDGTFSSPTVVKRTLTYY